jgi:hypothetical protein
MAIINVPKPPKSAFDKNRKLSTLLEWQIYHAQEAELAFPVDHSTDIYVNAIKTEGEAADYLRRVTEKVHELHGAPVQKPKAKPRRRGLTIAAAARPSAKRKTKTARASKAKSRKRKS